MVSPCTAPHSHVCGLLVGFLPVSGPSSYSGAQHGASPGQVLGGVGEQSGLAAALGQW